MMAQSEDEIVTLVRQRRKWSRAEKERIVATAMAPGAVASAVAREAGVQASQLFNPLGRLPGEKQFADQLRIVSSTTSRRRQGNDVDVYQRRRKVVCRRDVALAFRGSDLVGGQPIPGKR